MKEAETTTGAAQAERHHAKGRAFLVQVSPDCEPGSGGLRGRVQHLDTADGGNFASPEDLVAIVARILARRQDD